MMGSSAPPPAWNPGDFLVGLLVGLVVGALLLLLLQ